MRRRKRKVIVEAYDLSRHPYLDGNPKLEEIDPMQRGFHREVNRQKTDFGAEAERRITEVLAGIPGGRVLSDVYFLTGRYSEELELYYSMQIDDVFINKSGAFVIEVKNYGGSEVVIKGCADACNWKKNGKGMPNGSAQNRNHGAFVKQLFDFLGLDVPVYTITVICGVRRDGILVQEFIDDNLIPEEELVDRISYLGKRSMASVDVDAVCAAIESWKCIPSEERRRLHIRMCRALENNSTGVPKRCKGDKKCFVAFRK
ncbi:MAG: NERD domain-containing protein [Lachnospiraceae bacterium]|nr:NERD domain-containing protein [Lachnospiraceae bacterium]